MCLCDLWIRIEGLGSTLLKGVLYGSTLRGILGVETLAHLGRV